jgi:hypothetical protein
LPFRLWGRWERIRQEELSTTIKIQESDRAILRSHMANLHGNPRSIKRFVNTYLLAKGINTLTSLNLPEELKLEDLAAWLVLLQSWPHYGSLLTGHAARVKAQKYEPLFPEGWAKSIVTEEPPPELIAFVQSNREKLERLASSSRGLDIARCFSFFTVDA